MAIVADENTSMATSSSKKKGVFGKIRRSLGIGGSSSSGNKPVKHVSRSANVSRAVSTKEATFASGKVTEAPTTLKSPTTPTRRSTATTTAKKGSEEKPSKTTRKPWLTRTEFFRGLLNQAFETVDQDSSGTIDEKELYSGLLLIHLKLGMYAGPAACKPISREKCHSVFVKMDDDHSGALDRDEFDNVMCVLFGNVLFRVLFQYGCTIMLVPLLAQYVYKAIVFLLGQTTAYVASLDDDLEWANRLHAQVDLIWVSITNWLEDVVPVAVQDGYDVVVSKLDDIPSEVWDTIPITLLSTILSLMIIPWSLMKIDDFFQYLAERKEETPTKGTQKKEV
mmetsp:Transcript_28341/g.68942  ORF Transcript_28341/g.68942 Transcript_28341/m.68942 type:complete len:337 (-) Transcript_28341:235-1245(-)|eukprot:CAMPEP_0113490934 /NCGR_PEP_ID=MMETSP0014_2-20120614/27299_1 /TAXON_ID=2857 /ORGANISM="Nitzschia sp." /LENGTH=336 /DNA_ID=CAMNT_0000384715 /DNA_START=212 /DNA_END=1222 /DNA_ORIENTATION=- /assembly_acc=CAM_ASM_000159